MKIRVMTIGLGLFISLGAFAGQLKLPDQFQGGERPIGFDYVEIQRAIDDLALEMAKPCVTRNKMAVLRNQRYLTDVSKDMETYGGIYPEDLDVVRRVVEQSKDFVFKTRMCQGRR